MKFGYYILKFFIAILSVYFLFSTASYCYAIEDPLSKTNNFYGIHILFNDEITDSSRLVNSEGGDWGYVTIPLQAGDKDLYKWQYFMNKASELHVIPIIRLSTEEFFFQKGVWRKPDFNDIVDFANFLNSLYWPIKNKYIILFNEVNRFDEWGGESPDPEYYAEIVSFAYDIFKQRSDDFYIILGGFDNASVNVDHKYINEFEYLKRMFRYDNEIFNKIDGFASHSYPNPAFSQPPDLGKKVGTSTYKFEYDYINSLSKNKKYAFITETGWDKNEVSESKIAEYYKFSFENIWGKDSDKIVAITPFLFRGGNQYDKFSFLNGNETSEYYKVFKQIPKKKGEPTLNFYFIGPQIDFCYETKNFTDEKLDKIITSVPPALKLYFRMILGL